MFSDRWQTLRVGEFAPRIHLCHALTLQIFFIHTDTHILSLLSFSLSLSLSPSLLSPPPPPPSLSLSLSTSPSLTQASPGRPSWDSCYNNGILPLVWSSDWLKLFIHMDPSSRCEALSRQAHRSLSSFISPTPPHLAFIWVASNTPAPPSLDWASQYNIQSALWPWITQPCYCTGYHHYSYTSLPYYPQSLCCFKLKYKS